MHRAIVVFVGAALAASGCIRSDGGADGGDRDAGDDGGDAMPPGGPLAVHPFNLHACQATIVEIGVPASAVQPHVPEGFRVLSMSEVALPGAPSTQDGNLGVEMFLCESMDGLDGPVTGASYGSYFTMVEPPEELRRDDVTYHFVKWDTVVADEGLRAVLIMAGAPVWPGTASYDAFAPVATTIQTTGSLTMGDWTQTFDGAGVTPAPPLMTGSFVEYMQTAGGLVAWNAAWVFDTLAIGPVTVQVPEGSLAAEIMGTGPAQGAAFVGVIGFEGNVTIPQA